MAYRLATPNIQFMGANGVPLAGGSLAFYLSETNTPATTYSDAALTIPNANPIILDSAGYAGSIFLSVGQQYKVVLNDANGVQQWTMDPVSDPTSTGQTFANSLAITGAAGTTRSLFFQTAGSNRWALVCDQTAESGANAGSNFSLIAYTDGGAALVTAFSIDRATGQMTFNLPPKIVGPVTPPTGRLTLMSGTPVLTGNVSGAATIYYTPYLGNVVPLTDGLNFWQAKFSELSQALADTTKSPAAAVANSNYDIFVWLDGSTIRATRGPTWTSDASRGTGIGTTELILSNGFYVNKNAISNGPNASRGIYVGSIRTNASATVDFVFGGSAAGGSPASFGVWNYFNRARVAATISDSTASWSYNTNAWRAANNSTNNRASFICGMPEDAMSAYAVAVANPNSAPAAIGVGVNSTTAPSAIASIQQVGVVTYTGSSAAIYNSIASFGWQFIQQLENGSGSVDTTWFGGGNTYLSFTFSL